MEIGIEAERANNPIKTGVEHYAHQLILHLAKIDAKNEYILYLRTEPEEWIKQLPSNFSYKVMPFPIFWTQLRISYEMFMHPPDVLFIPASSMPLIHPKRTVVTVHDFAFMLYPETYTWFARSFHKLEDLLVRMFAWKVIAVSEATKKDFVKFYGADSSRISVVHHGYKLGVSSKGLEVRGEKQSGSLPSPLIPRPSSLESLPEKYLLFLSTLQPRKNLEGLVKAYVELKKEQPEIPHKLVVVGKPGWKFENTLELLKKNEKDVVYLNYVTEEEKAYIFKHATALVLPSFYEGFGMQILEAFEAGVPVLTSNVSSMPEVAGEAGLYFDPHNITDMKKAISQVLADQSLRDRLIEKGYERLKEFSWDKCARETLELLSK